jgi:hypothetical protein
MSRVSVGGEVDVVYVYECMQWVCIVFASRAGWGGSVWRGVGGRWRVDVVWRVEGWSSRLAGWLALALSPPLLLSSLALTLALSASPAKQPSLSGDGLGSSF